jgi:signal transduction histidine kinase/CheY-like chemotaxis protein/PAS domain-containing protein
MSQPSGHLPAPESARPTGSVSGWLQEFIPYGVFTTDRELRITSWNRWLVVHSGRLAEHVIGRPLTEIYPDLGEPRLKRFLSALTGEISVLSAALHQHLLPLPLVTRETEVTHMLQTARISPLVEEGEIVGTIAIVEDVTQREVQAGILHRQQELDRLLSEALSILMRSEDPARDVADVFPLLLPALGLDVYLSYLMGASRKTLHLNVAGGVTPAQREGLATVAVAADDFAPHPGSESILAGTIRLHEASLAAIGLKSTYCFPLSIGQRMIGLVSFGSYEEKRLPPGDEMVLSRVAQYVAIALDRSMRERDILAASRAKDDFLAALSHELRTPLNPVLLLASDCAGNRDYPQEAREAFRVIEKNALLEARLIDDLLDLTRIEHGKTSLERQRVDLHSVLADALVTIRAESGARDREIQVELQAQPSVVQGDAARLQQVFWNLLKNAIKFTPAGGCIRVLSNHDPDLQEIAIQISDTGIGLSPDEVERIFGAFVQGEHAASGRGHRFGGLGLGLAISRKLVELHGGRIRAASDGRNRGATFTVTLPTASPALSREAPFLSFTETRPPMEASKGANEPVRQRLLLVEDHEPTRVPLARLLERRGFGVCAVGSATEALAEADRQLFDLVLSDIGLPDGDGFSLMKELRDLHHLKGIALTGYGTEDDIARGREVGFVAHLTKPIGIVELDRTLASAFSHGASAR